MKYEDKKRIILRRVSMGGSAIILCDILGNIKERRYLLCYQISVFKLLVLFVGEGYQVKFALSLKSILLVKSLYVQLYSVRERVRTI
jgi:hypothetical protein